MPECRCGNPGRELLDAAGIYCGLVCGKCEREVRAKFRPDIFEDSGYWTDEVKEPEENNPAIIEPTPVMILAVNAEGAFAFRCGENLNPYPVKSPFNIAWHYGYQTEKTLCM